MSNVYSATSLIGGVVGSLDNIDGANLYNRDVAIVAIHGLELMPYVLDVDSGEAENSPYIISPDSNPGDKRWKLIGFKGAFSHVKARSSSGQSMPDTTSTTIVFGTEDYDLLGEYVHTTGIFTATYTGVYIVSAAIMLSSAAWGADDQIRMELYRDSTREDVLARGTIETATTATHAISGSGAIKLTAGDTIKVNLVHTQGGAVLLNSTDDYNWLTIDRIA